jgi:uncharacterized protein (DUF3820 family)
MQTNIICPKCKSVDDYYTEQRGIHTTAFCNQCKSYIKNLPQGKPAQLFFGKYKDRLISDMTNQDEVGYLKWLLKTDVKPNSLKQAITDYLNSL